MLLQGPRPWGQLQAVTLTAGPYEVARLVLRWPHALPSVSGLSQGRLEQLEGTVSGLKTELVSAQEALDRAAAEGHPESERRVCTVPWLRCAPGRLAPALSSPAWAHRPSPGPSLSGVPLPPRLPLVLPGPSLRVASWLQPVCLSLSPSAGHSWALGSLLGCSLDPGATIYPRGLAAAGPLPGPPELQLARSVMRSSLPTPPRGSPRSEAIPASLLGDLCPPRPRAESKADLELLVSRLKAEGWSRGTPWPRWLL